MGYKSTDDYLKILDQLADNETPEDLIPPLMAYLKSIYRSDQENLYSAPMKWIGMYIAIASLVCILAMAADLLHGLRSRKLWFPCRYFRINSAFISLIAIAMKLPVDLTSSMPGNVDQAGKLGSVAFMCTMMANLLPCLATMDSDELLTNVTALGILVITMVVNICIQIHTGVVSYDEDDRILKQVAPRYSIDSVGLRRHRNAILAWIYEVLLLLLLLLHVCSCLALLKSKKIIESKYQKRHHPVHPPSTTTVKKLEQHVINDWIMAGSGSPQFITACFPTTSASGVICVVVTALHTLTMYWTIEAIITKDCDSDYSWSMIVILIVQFIGVVIGTIAPLCRCFATLSFKVSPKIISDHLKVFEVESYWTSKLYEWKRGGTKLRFISHRRLEVVTETLKRLVLRLWIEVQEGVVVFCKIVSLVPFVFMICVWYFSRFLTWFKVTVCSTSCKKDAENSEQRLKEMKDVEDLCPYVLHLEDEMELAGTTLKGLKTSADRLIQKGENRQQDDLLQLITKPNGGFEGVKKFDHLDHHQVPGLLTTIQHQDCWSLPVVTLTTIAVSLRGKETEAVKNLLKSVWKGLWYVTLVEESFSVVNEDVSCQKEAETLWKEVHINQKWLRYEFPDCKAKTAGSIVEWFRDTAKNVDKVKRVRKDDPIHRSICANSMYHITKTILHNYQTNIENVNHDALFDDLSSMIGDIIAACLTNLPQVIIRKCDKSTIEKREDSVKDAAILLGETKKIIDTVYKDRGSNIPEMDPSDLPFINKWREHLRLNCIV